jgi:hypothetical protein
MSDRANAGGMALPNTIAASRPAAIAKARALNS